jgi:hypothetical protein
MRVDHNECKIGNPPLHILVALSCCHPVHPLPSRTSWDGKVGRDGCDGRRLFVSLPSQPWRDGVAWRDANHVISAPRADLFFVPLCDG